ncbi:class I SAM-dependent methyltransferase [Chitinophaga sp. Hz27]|uniref:class I SAM-dependent methyltransferase n=1 Tax=Chitinophaga sp. Hz27 TaxID=3347169 RepID=UPI0035DDE47C
MKEINETTVNEHTAIQRLVVGFSEKPFDIFLINTGDISLVGQKSPARINMESEQLRKCCLVEPHMIKGALHSIEMLQEGYEVKYKIMQPAEIAAVFSNMSPLDELSYPLRRLVNGGETAQPMEYWENCAGNPSTLDGDEQVVREAMNTLLNGSLQAGMTVYDPACSTGAFLAYLKTIAPGIKTVGQDINPAMVEIAKGKVDEVHLGDSSAPACMDNTADIVICRHLNLDVVTSDVAKELFLSASRTLKTNGLMIVLGHTPILLTSAWMELQGYTALNRSMLTTSGHAAFQLYLFKKK